MSWVAAWQPSLDRALGDSRLGVQFLRAGTRPTWMVPSKQVVFSGAPAQPVVAGIV